MSNSLFKLVADGRMSAEHLAQILIALDKDKSPKVLQVHVDFDDICDEHMMELVNATHQTTLTYLKLAFGAVNKNIAQSFVEVANFNTKIEKCWLLLGNNHLFYRDNEMGDIEEVLHLDYPKQVTINCQTMTADQVDEFVRKVNQCSMIEELNVKIAKLEEGAAQEFVEKIRANPKLKKWSLTLNDVCTRYTAAEEDLITQFSGLMSDVKSDLIQASNIAQGYASDLLEQGKVLVSAFTAPMRVCMQPDNAEEFVERRNALLIEEKKAMNKYL